MAEINTDLKAAENEVFVLGHSNFRKEVNQTIGVCDNWNRVDKMLLEYFGDYEQKDFKDIRDSALEFTMELTCQEGIYHYVSLHSYNMNQV